MYSHFISPVGSNFPNSNKQMLPPSEKREVQLYEHRAACTAITDVVEPMLDADLFEVKYRF